MIIPPYLWFLITKPYYIFCCQDVAIEIGKELQGKPDLIIGNYSDGNIVASLLAHKLGVTQVCCQELSLSLSYFLLLYIDASFCARFTNCYLMVCYNLQCTIAHALEKTKYPDSDIYWKKLDDKYHFSCQFTADLIAMNHTDFIITSTFQEIAGR